MNALIKTVAPIVVVLASLGSLFFVAKIAGTKKSQASEIVALKGDVTQTKGKLAKSETTLKDAQAALMGAQNEAAQASAAAQTAKNEAQAAKTAADQKVNEVQDQLAAKDKQIADVKAQLAKNATELQKLQENAIKTAELEKLDEIKAKVTALTDENKELGRQLGVLRDENRKLLAAKEELTTTPVTVRGQIASVQDRWGFVVLNVGEAQQVRANSQFLVYRDSKLVCKVQVVSVAAQTSIAEVLTDYQRGEPRVGDLVVR